MEERIGPLRATDSTNWIVANHNAFQHSQLYWKSRGKAYWFEYLPESKVLYFQYNSVRNDPIEPIDKFAERMFKFIDENDVQALVVDTRWNGGGNSFLNLPFVNGIIKRDRINTRDRLFVITKRQTFSACQNFVTDLGRACQPIYVGEPTGS